MSIEFAFQWTISWIAQNKNKTSAIENLHVEPFVSQKKAALIHKNIKGYSG